MCDDLLVPVLVGDSKVSGICDINGSAARQLIFAAVSDLWSERGEEFASRQRQREKMVSVSRSLTGPLCCRP